MTKNRERRYIPDDSQKAFGLAIGGLAPLVIAGLLVPFRTDSIVATNVALVFVIVVVVAAAEGGRSAGIVAAVVSTLSFDFFFTRPFQSLKIDNADDIGTAVLLLVISLVVAQLVGFVTAAASGVIGAMTTPCGCTAWPSSLLAVHRSTRSSTRSTPRSLQCSRCTVAGTNWCHPRSCPKSGASVRLTVGVATMSATN